MRGLCIPFSDVEFDSYHRRLAELSIKHRKCRQAYVSKVEKKLVSVLQHCTFDELFDPLTGGIIFYDDEWEVIDKRDPFKLLLEERDEEGCYKYILPLDGKILLRGSEIYYFFSCYLSRFKNPTHKQMKIWFRNVVIFLQKVLKNIPNYDEDSDISRRILLGVMDNIRNILLIFATAELLHTCSGENAILEEGDTVWSVHIRTCHKIMYTLCFGQSNSSDFTSEIEVFIEEIIKNIATVRTLILSINDGYLLLKCVNPWREADNYLENLVGMMYVAEELQDCKKPIRLIGLLCGGLELPYILGELLCTEASVCFLFQRTGLYMEKLAAFRNDFSRVVADTSDENIMNIMVDENAQSGISAQLAIRQLNCRGILVQKLILLRGPSIARIEQLRNCGSAIDLEGFTNGTILGGLYSSPYTKLKKNTNYGGMYLDETKLFSYGAEVFLKALYRNNTFIKDSEADIFSGYSHGKDKMLYEGGDDMD